MPAPCAFQVGDAVAMPVGGELRLLRIVQSLDGRFVCADSDPRRALLELTQERLSKGAERVRG